MIERPRDQPDVVLVAAAQRGESDALNALLERHHDRIRSVCQRVTGNSADAADATQEALIAIARGIRRFEGTSSFTTWIYRIATNAALDELRRRGRRAIPSSPMVTGTETAAEVAASQALVGTGDTDFGSVDSVIDVERALAHLTPEFRAPLVLRDVCGLDYAEIAEVLGVPGGTVRSRIARARAAIAPQLRIATQPLTADSSQPREPQTSLTTSKDRL